MGRIELKAYLYFSCIGLIFSLQADRFSEYAEARNILDAYYYQLPIAPCPIEVHIDGYVKAEGIVDTRQNDTLRDGHLLYFPLDERIDPLGNDINGRGMLDLYAIQSLITFWGYGPEICGFTPHFRIEADFYGRSDRTINEFEQQYSFIELKSENLSFLFGQFYHPLVFPYGSPNTISFNSGIPIAPYALTPQFKVAYQPHRSVELLASAIGYVGDRPFGVGEASDKIFRDGMMPDFFFMLRLLANEENYCGVGFDVMRIVPRLATNRNCKELEIITPIVFDAFIRYQYQDFFTIYSKIVYAQNAATFELIGGLAIASVDPITDLRTYTPLRTCAWYIEFIKQGFFEPALFIGVAKNLGAGKPIIPELSDQESTVFGIGTNIDTVFRISPRVRWYLKSLIIGIEYEYTRAAYGILNQTGSVINTNPVANNRLLLATYYLF